MSADTSDKRARARDKKELSPEQKREQEQLKKAQKAIAELLRAILPHTSPEIALRLKARESRLAKAYALNTILAWRASWETWVEFCKKNPAAPNRPGRNCLPADLSDIESFVHEKVSYGRKRPTINQYLSTLNVLHRFAEVLNPLSTMDGEIFLKEIRTSKWYGRKGKGKLSLGWNEIEQMVSKCDRDNLQDLRNTALVCFLHNTLCRRSEVSELRKRDITINADGTGTVNVWFSKTERDGDGSEQFVGVETVELLQEWWRRAEVKDEDFAFLSMTRHGTIRRARRPMSGNDIARTVKMLCKRVGLAPARFAAHSLRRGATVDMLRQELSTAKIMKEGRWKSAQMVVQYGRHLEKEGRAMAKLMGAKQQPQRGRKSSSSAASGDEAGAAASVETE